MTSNASIDPNTGEIDLGGTYKTVYPGKTVGTTHGNPGTNIGGDATVNPTGAEIYQIDSDSNDITKSPHSVIASKNQRIIEVQQYTIEDRNYERYSGNSDNPSTDNLSSGAAMGDTCLSNGFNYGDDHSGDDTAGRTSPRNDNDDIE